MKKLRFAFILFFVFLISGCSDAKKYEVILEGSSSSYYNWSCEIEDSSVLSIVDEQYFGKEANDEISGLEGEYKFVFKPLKEGNVTVTFKYMRSWEEDDVLYEYVLKLNVDDKLRVTKVSESGNYLSLEKILTYDLEKLDLEKNFSEYKLIFDNNIVNIDGKECDFLTIYDYQDIIVGVFGISKNENTIYKMIDGEMVIVE